MEKKKSIYVRNIPSVATKQNIYDSFVIFGEINNIEYDAKSNSAIVTFDEQNDANSALENMDNSELFGQTISVIYATSVHLSNRQKAIWNQT